MAWQPTNEGLTQVLEIFRKSQIADRNIQRSIQEQLSVLNQHPDFNYYLVFVFTELKNEPEYVRAVAGLFLKNNVRQSYDNIPDEVKQFIKTQILKCIGDPMPQIRKTVGSIISTIVTKGGLKQWQNLIPTLIQLLDNNDLNVVSGVMQTMVVLCEDYSDKLDSEEAGRPLGVLIPKFLALFKSQHEILRKHALACINCFLVDMPSALLVNMDSYLQGVFFLASDSSEEVRKGVCHAFVTLVEIRIDYLLPHLRNVIQYMLVQTQDKEETVAMEACEFWSAIAETKYCKDALREFLPSVIPVLLDCMVYGESDMMLMGFEEDDENVPDQAKDIKPFIYSSKSKGFGQPQSFGSEQTPQGQRAPNGELDEEEEEDDEEDNSTVSEWTLRKCAASGLDILSTVFKDDLLPVVLPLLQQKLNHTDWKVRESAILAIGAIADGCRKGIKQHLATLVPYMFTLLGDVQPLVRSITCWTLSRYSRWIVQQEDDKYFRTFVSELLNRILDKNKKVQEAACSAFASFEEEAETLLVPYLNPILRCFVMAFEKYQAKNLIILYDAVGTLAESVGDEMNNPEYINIIMPPLITKWNNLGDEDRNLLPLLECLTSVAAAVGTGFQQFAQGVYQRCLRLIENTLVKQAAAQQNQQELPDKEFVICALDLISGLTEGLKAGIESLVGSSNLINLLFECMKDSKPDVCQSAFALVGDLAKCCIAHLKPVLNGYLPLLIQNLNPYYIAVCNNASWALGEVAMRVEEEIFKPFVPAILQKLIPIVNRTALNRNLLENTAITIGRLGFVSPDAVAPLLEHFVQAWCLTLRDIREDYEKESAFRGLCKMIKLNPNGVVRSFVFVCDAIASWEHPPKDLAEMFYHILHGFKSSLSEQAWSEYYNTFPPQLRMALSSKYQL
mmetsp:Transcript_11007/g.15159  ORF Transcript_11007/g.15159 Transcript_11007/m.15159 type:complete len:901 (+) Transcript_11007:157-2859(+)